MDEKNLPVPYASQWDNDAIKSNNDCGAASIAMVLRFFGEKLTTDQVQEKTGAGAGLVTIGQMQKAITELGFASEYYANQSFDNVKNFLLKGIPVIALIHYGSLISTQDKNFKGGHFMPIVGFRSDGGIYANDPNFKGDIRGQGDHHNYTQQEFMAAWGDCNLDGNANNSFVVIYPKPNADKGINIKVRVTPGIGLKARTSPTINAVNIAKVFAVGTVLEVVGQEQGDTVEGSNLWFKVDEGDKLYYVASVFTQVIEANNVKTEEVKPKEEKKVEDKKVETVDYQKLYVASIKENDKLKKVLAKVMTDVEEFSDEGDKTNVGQADGIYKKTVDKIKEILNIKLNG